MYAAFNQLADDVEEHLTEEISLEHLATFFNVNVATFRAVFHLMVGMTVTRYIRERRLSVAAEKLKNESVTAVALEFGYNSPEAFSRAFSAFHGFLPSDKSRNDYRITPRLYFPLSQNGFEQVQLKRVCAEEMVLFGVGETMPIKEIRNLAPRFWDEVTAKNAGHNFNYGVIKYGENYEADVNYYVATRDDFGAGEKLVFAAGEWLVFNLEKNEKTVAEFSDLVFTNYLPTLKKEVVPWSLEVYFDERVELWFPS
jgi:AraC-like DNA-binding protein/predicted transcriptional regulator YdeE